MTESLFLYRATLFSSTQTEPRPIMHTPVLYVYPKSVWASVPELALIELGYAPDAVLREEIDLAAGENFGRDFYKVSKNATLPALEANGKHYTTTTEVTKYLVEHAPTPKKTGQHQAVIDALHTEQVDPNFAKVAARCEEELQKKRNSPLKQFIAGRYAAAVKYDESAQTQMKEFYASKLPDLQHMEGIYSGSASAEDLQAFFQKSTQHWQEIDIFVSEKLPRYLPAHGFIEGPAPGEADFHVAAWLARIVDCCIDSQTASCNEEMQALARELRDEVPEEVERYWNNWTRRESWKTVYQGGLH